MTARDRLPFVLPDFTRITWTSERARAVWEPRVRKVSRAWAHTEWLSVAKGVRRACLTRMSAAQFHANSTEWSRHNVSALGLASEAAGRCGYSSTVTTARTGQPPVVCVGLSMFDDMADLKRAWDSGNQEQLGALLGYPACCRRFFRRVWVDDGQVDTTWHMGAATAGAILSGSRLEVAGPDACNILFRWVGVRSVPHLPCSFDCDGTVKLADTLREVAVEAGFSEEMTWTREMLSWPVEWSALHGIAEIRTPILKISTRTDATSRKFEVRRAGSSYPEQGATGLRFPYRVTGPGPTTQVFELRPPARAWQYSDNGFPSQASMDRAQAPLLDLVAHAIGDGGNVLDLGCGNAMLLKKIRGRVGNGVVPFGIDRQAQCIAHARTLLPEFASNFHVDDMFAAHDRWLARRQYRLALISVNRLFEVPQDRAKRFAEDIRQLCDSVVVYQYPSASAAHDLDAVANVFGWPVALRSPNAALVVGRTG
jgi:hypothetical protein